MPNITGLQEFQQHLNRLKNSYHGRAGASLYKFATMIKNDARDRAPKKTGELRKSGRVHDPISSGDGRISCKITFGNEKAYYAIYVHEDLNAKHTNGEAKFLENAVNASTSKMAEFLKTELYQSWWSQ